jgi:hypothetical protein
MSKAIILIAQHIQLERHRVSKLVAVVLAGVAQRQDRTLGVPPTIPVCAVPGEEV